MPAYVNICKYFTVYCDFYTVALTASYIASYYRQTTKHRHDMKTTI